MSGASTYRFSMRHRAVRTSIEGRYAAPLIAVRLSGDEMYFARTGSCQFTTEVETEASSPVAVSSVETLRVAVPGKFAHIANLPGSGRQRALLNTLEGVQASNQAPRPRLQLEHYLRTMAIRAEVQAFCSGTLFINDESRREVIYGMLKLGVESCIPELQQAEAIRLIKKWYLPISPNALFENIRQAFREVTEPLLNALSEQVVSEVAEMRAKAVSNPTIASDHFIYRMQPVYKALMCLVDEWEWTHLSDREIARKTVEVMWGRNGLKGLQLSNRAQSVQPVPAGIGTGIAVTDNSPVDSNHMTPFRQLVHDALTHAVEQWVPPSQKAAACDWVETRWGADAFGYPRYWGTPAGALFFKDDTTFACDLILTEDRHVYQVPAVLTRDDQQAIRQVGGELPFRDGRNFAGRGSTATVLYALRFKEDGPSWGAVKAYNGSEPESVATEKELARIVSKDERLSAAGIGAQSFLFMRLAWSDGYELVGMLAAIPDSAAKQAAQRTVARLFVKSVAALHERGVYHRDVKSENILVYADGDAALADLGFATGDTARRTAVFDDPGNPQLEAIEPDVGTPQFIPFRGTSKYVDPAYYEPDGSTAKYGDLYSLGVVLLDLAYFGSLPDEWNSQAGSDAFPDFTWEEIAHLEGDTLEEVAKCLMCNEPDFRPSLADVMSMPYFENGPSMPESELVERLK